MTRSIVIGQAGHIESLDHQQAITHGGGDVLPGSVVRFYFDEGTYVDVKFDSDFDGKGCLQVRAMANKVPSMAVIPSSGNTVLIVPGG